MAFDQHTIDLIAGTQNHFSDRTLLGYMYGIVNNESPGSISSITVDTAGSYASIPSVALTGNGSAGVIVTHMGALTASLASVGSGYVPTGTSTLSGGTESANAVMTVTNTQLVSTAVNAPGTGYLPGVDVITTAGGTASPHAVLSVTGVGLVSATNNTHGINYVENDVLTLVGGTGTPATITVNTVSSGAIATFTVTTPGLYTAVPASFTVTGGSGTEATFNAAVYGVGAVTISNAGVYTTNSSTFTQGSNTGAGTSATFETNSYGINAFTISTAGSYTVLPTNPVSQGSSSAGTGATYTINTWAIATISVSNAGTGYDNTSAVSITGGGSTGGGSATINLSNTGDAVTTQVNWSGASLPSNYSVIVTPSQPCFVSVGTKEAASFVVTFTPVTSSSTISTGTFDAAVFG